MNRLSPDFIAFLALLVAVSVVYLILVRAIT